MARKWGAWWRSWRVWLAVVAVVGVVGRRLDALLHVPPSPFAVVRRDDALDASLLLLFQPATAPVGGGALTPFGLRKRHSLPLIRGGQLH